MSVWGRGNRGYVLQLWLDGGGSSAKAEIARHERSPLSLMPAGLLEALPEVKACELLKYLTSKP